MSERDERLAALHVVRLSSVENSELREGMSQAINLMDNIQRGLFAEVLVAIAGGGELTDPWEAWDVNLSDGTKVEVKTSGLIQSWSQKQPSALQWDVEPHSAWILTNEGFTPDPERTRRSDLYVFAVHDGVNPGDTTEWTFRLVETQNLDEVLGDQKTISIGSLDDQFNPAVFGFEQLSAQLGSRASA